MDETELTYPRFQLKSGSDLVWPDNLSHSEETLVRSLVVDENMMKRLKKPREVKLFQSSGRKNKSSDSLLQSLTSSQKDKGITISLQWISSIQKHLSWGMWSMV